MMFPIWSIAERSYPQTEQNAYTRVLFRCSVVLLSTIVAYSIPDFGKFLSLVGSSICTILGFILPCYFHLVVMKEELQLWQIYLDYFLICAGAIIGTLGTIESCQAMLTGNLEGSHR
jgi:proton-coupled amino acid transporter